MNARAAIAQEPLRHEVESLPVLFAKWLVYGAAVVLYLLPLATEQAIGASIGALAVGMLLARFAHTHALRLPVTLVLAGLCVLLAFVAGQWLLDTSTGFGSRLTLILSDAVFFSLLSLGMIVALRSLSMRARVFSVLEVAFVVGAVAYTFVGHRNHMIHRPRFLSDWAWSNGWDPQMLLQAFGVVAVLASLVMLLRVQSVFKLILSALTLLLVAALFFLYAKDVRIDQDVDTNGLGLTDQEQKDKGDKGRGGQDGDGDGNGGGVNQDNPYNTPSSAPDIVVPVAIAVFHDDYEPKGGLYYFRQQVLSRYNGHHLVVAGSDTDQDVITEFPQNETLSAEPVQVMDAHLQVPTSMFLLVDHPQPLALTNSVSVSPLENPNPRHFVSAYGVVSYTLSMDYDRLLGRRSIPDSWAPEKKAHYLELPDDPRYKALSDIIVRDLDPRFAQDDVMKAFAIKRYLEKQGFYTRKENHEDAVDPAADFLFGSMRGYCVHFAHAATFLFRSQGIAARVALGYAVDNQYRTGGSTVMILNDRAHAWPEIFIEGVGWITFDIYPEQSDEPPGRIVDQDLESVLGELARNDKTAGKAADPDSKPLEIPWRAIWLGFLVALAAFLALAYLIKAFRRLMRFGSAFKVQRRIFVATLDGLGDLGFIREEGETRERYARRLQDLSPSLAGLTDAHLAWAFGSASRPDLEQTRALSRKVREELAKNLPLWRRVAGWINPVGWWFTR